MVDINLIYKSNSDFLKAEDIGNAMPEYTIKSADHKEIGTDKKVVLEFADTEKLMPLNITNAKAIAEMYGVETALWIGQKIMLFTMPVDYQGRMVQAIRIRAPQSGMTTPSASPPAGYDERNPPPVGELTGTPSNVND